MRNVFLWDNRVMGSAHQAGPKGATNKRLTDGNRQDKNEHKEAPCGGEGHALSEEDESKINVALEDLNGNQIEDATPLAKQTAGFQKQEQQPPGPIVRWERFLPVRTLKESKMIWSIAGTIDDCMGKNMKIQECRKPEMQYETHSTEQDFTKLAGKKMEKLPEKDSKNEGHLGTFHNDLFNEPKAPSGFSKAIEVEDKINHTSNLPSIELSLKRLRSIGDSGTANQDGRNVLRRLELSAFSRCKK
ncbi:hypothetical protein BHE74_00014026 [Ensete ventricosum]|nr:hypothetical protein BHE74_00014026 [Ensete ventricosum]